MTAMLLESAVEQGFIYALVALALFLSYRVLDIADLTTDGTFVLGSAVSAVFSAAGKPVPRLMELDIWYWASTPPDRAVQPLAMHSPTVMVKAGSMEEALTMSRLSPVARMDRPIWVLRKRAIAAPAARVMAAQTIILLQPGPSRAAARVNTVSALSRGRSARLPMVHRLLVYRPVMVTMPARRAVTFIRVGRKAVTKAAARCLNPL